MKIFLYTIVLLFGISACKSKKAVINTTEIEILLKDYKPSPSIKENEDDLLFWKSRIDSKNIDAVNLPKYAAALSLRFKIQGDINDLLAADSIYQLLDKHFLGKEAAYKIAQISSSLMQHKFVAADSFLQQANKLGIGEYEKSALSFDVYFETGNTEYAFFELAKIKNYKDYNFMFRNAKIFHYNGNVDSAVANMQAASDIAMQSKNIPLAQSAISNTADLLLHNGDLQKAKELYLQSITLNNTDLHSFMGLGTIAMLHDKNDMLAEKIFKFIQTKTKQPDVIFKLAQLNMQSGDSIAAKKYATEFVTITSNKNYGNMYNKYLIQLYTSILNNPIAAEKIALQELESRNTPQTNAWYVYTLLKNNKLLEANKIYEKNVSGKPLEGLESFWMGKYMQANNKGYNANEFFKNAQKNKYDLAPDAIKELADMKLE